MPGRAEVPSNQANLGGARRVAEVATGEGEGTQRERDRQGDPEDAVQDPEQRSFHHVTTVATAGLTAG
jgi:hypothetical protein